MNWLALALLPLVLAPLGPWRLWERSGFDRTGRPRFAVLALRAVVRIGAPSLVALAVLGRWRDLVVYPTELIGQVDWALQPLQPGDAAWAVPILGAAVVVGMTLGAAVTAWRAWRGRREVRWLGDFAALEARRGREIGGAVLVSLAAACTEELCFRLVVPLLLTLLLGHTLVLEAVIAANLIFGLMHRYQGWRGVVATTLVGLALAEVFATTGQLWFAVATHVAVDINSLVLRPLIRRRLGRTGGAGTG